MHPKIGSQSVTGWNQDVQLFKGFRIRRVWTIGEPAVNCIGGFLLLQESSSFVQHALRRGIDFFVQKECVSARRSPRPGEDGIEWSAHHAGL